jgi:hypothetical protein
MESTDHNRQAFQSRGNPDAGRSRDRGNATRGDYTLLSSEERSFALIDAITGLTPSRAQILSFSIQLKGDQIFRDRIPERARWYLWAGDTSRNKTLRVIVASLFILEFPEHLRNGLQSAVLQPLQRLLGPEYWTAGGEVSGQQRAAWLTEVLVGLAADQSQLARHTPDGRRPDEAGGSAPRADQNVRPPSSRQSPLDNPAVTIAVREAATALRDARSTLVADLIQIIKRHRFGTVPPPTTDGIPSLESLMGNVSSAAPAGRPSPDSGTTSTRRPQGVEPHAPSTSRGGGEAAPREESPSTQCRATRPAVSPSGTKRPIKWPSMLQ